MSFIDPDEGTHILGNHAIRIEGLTVIVYDVDQFMHVGLFCIFQSADIRFNKHYYHWWGEIILGFWRVYSKLSAGEDGSISSLPFPARFILPVRASTISGKTSFRVLAVLSLLTIHGEIKPEWTVL